MQTPENPPIFKQGEEVIAEQLFTTMLTNIVVELGVALGRSGPAGLVAVSDIETSAIASLARFIEGQSAGRKRIARFVALGLRQPFKEIHKRIGRDDG